MMEHNLVHQSPGHGREMVYSSNLRSMELALEDDKVSFSIAYLDGTVEVTAAGPEDLACSQVAQTSLDGSTTA